MLDKFSPKYLPVPSGRSIIMPPSIALRSVTSKADMGVYASSDLLYKGAVFGRDSLEVAEDIMTIRPQLVRAIILTLARLQGVRHNPQNEEEPGKIIHEYRTSVVDGKKIDARSQEILRKLAQKWGGSNEELAYYGSVDATPHFIRVVGTFTENFGDEILDQPIELRDKSSITVRTAVDRAVRWLLEKIASSRSGFLEYLKMHPNSITNQVWKDSEEFYVHDNGEAVNHTEPVASIEVQGLVFDALLKAGALQKDQAPVRAAERIRDLIFSKLWLGDSLYFALGVDSVNGNSRLITTPTANPGALLDTALFDHLSKDQKQYYIGGILRTILGHDFLTNAGIRSRALSRAHLIDHWDYHGSFVSWPKETYDIAKGLRRQGFDKLARQLENRILNICLRYRGYPEFVYVNGHGRVLANPPSRQSHAGVIVVEGTNKPEHIQAWTVSAIMAIVSGRFRNKLKLPGKRVRRERWQLDIENSLYNAMPHIDRHINPFSLRTHYPSTPYKLKQSDGE